MSLLCACSDYLSEIINEKDYKSATDSHSVSIQEAIEHALPYIEEAEVQKTRISKKRSVEDIQILNLNGA